MSNYFPAPPAEVPPVTPSGAPAPPPAPAPVSAPGFLRGTALIASLELRQRLRAKTLWVLAAVWFGIIGIVTLATWLMLSLSASTYDEDFDAYPLFSLIVYFVLLFGTLVAPAISAGSISSERTGGTLATTQVTLIGTWSILLGKALAAWITGIAFLVVASPFVVLSLALSHTSPLQLLTALLALALQIALFTAIGVGLSALISSPLFAIVTAYLMVALLTIGTVIAFGLSAGVATRYVEVEYRTFSQEYWEEYWQCDYDDIACQEAVPIDCVTETMIHSTTPTHRFWWILAMNPYVIVGDMVSVREAELNGSEDIFSLVSYLVRSLQLEPGENMGWSDCPSSPPYIPEGPDHDPLEGTIPVWWIGLSLQVLLAGLALLGGYRRLHTPAARLPKGSRIA